jgi:hypothetical protein
MPSLKNHPHKYALDIFKLSLDRIPVTVPSEIIDQAHRDFEMIAENLQASGEAIEDANMKLGRAIWPYLKAYDELYAKFGKEKENEVFLEVLRPDVKEHYEKWNRSGGLIFDIRRGEEFENAFAPEEKFALEEAYLDAGEAARSYVDELVRGEKAAEYQKALEVWKERQAEMLERIAMLRAMANDSEKWSGEILGKVRLFELGWAVTERDPELYEIEKEIENWRGVLDVDGLS